MSSVVSITGSQNVLSPYKQEDAATEERIVQILTSAQEEMQKKHCIEKVSNYTDISQSWTVIHPSVERPLQWQREWLIGCSDSSSSSSDCNKQTSVFHSIDRMLQKRV